MRIVLCLFLVVIPLQNFGQELPSKPLMDTILIKKGQTFISKSYTYTFKADTVLILPSSLVYEIVPSKSEAFFNRIAQTADKRRWTHELHNIIITTPNSSNKLDSVKTSASVLPYVDHTGFPIRKIIIKQLDVFGPTINDTNRVARSWIERTGNKLHFRTKKRFIQNSLLFKEGDYVDPIVLADNERILRGLPYLEDARIIVNSSGIVNDSADIMVLVKDVWSTAFNIDVENVYSGRFDIWDKNIFGLGHEIQSGILWKTNDIPSTGVQNSYTINNISNTFISGKLFYNNSFHDESYGIKLQRDFFTPNIKYAGGLSWSNLQSRVLFKVDTLNIYQPIQYNSFNFWAGRSFQIKRSGFAKMRHNFTLTGGLMRNQFFERPQISETSYYNLQSKTLLLASASYSNHSYFKSNFIYNFGRTEDIPIGSEISVTVGKEINEFANRSYAASKLSLGTFIGNVGYFYTSLNFGSFFLKDGKLEQGVITSQFQYFSPLVLLKRYKFRQFVNFIVTSGINRFSNEYLTLNHTNGGISGFVNDSVYGTQRLNMHWETTCFTPWEFYDFRCVLFAFADHSWLANSSAKLLSKLPYTGIGLGIRIRNERLVFNTIQIGFTIYPNIPSGSKTKTFEISGEPLLNSPNFLPQSPGLIPYQ